MPRNYQQKSGKAKMYRDDRFNSVTIPHPVLGIVKDNIDADRNGKIRVYLTEYGGADPNDSNSWITVSYMSPWFGATEASAGTSDDGTYLTNSHSYGFWATAPDVGTEVICIFVNGRPNQGYYIGCLPDSGAHFMVPAIGASNRVVPNQTEATSYGGADRLPTTELNVDNPKYRDSPNQLNEPKPVHSYQASIIANQGLIRDNIRGVVGSTSMRESPSAVFGISTPGAPIWDGGYTRQNIQTMISDPKTDASKLKIVGRTGGHSLVMDDGELLNGRNQMVRLRSAGGHQITMSDDGQVLFITHSNGQSWVELGPEGTVDIFSTNSFNVRTQGDINLHADNNININAKKALNINAESMNVQTTMATAVKVGTDFTIDTTGKHSHKIGGTLSLQSKGAASLASSAETFVNGSKVNLNSGNGPAAVAVPMQKQVQHVETTFSQSKGWMNPAPQPTMSITSRLPTHQPFAGASKGVDVPVEPVSQAGSANPSPSVTAASVATSTPPPVMTTAAVTATTPMVAQPANSPLPATTVQALTSQNAVETAMMSPADKAMAGVLPGPAGITAAQAEAAGTLKPGTAAIVQQNLAMGMTPEMAVPSAFFTGKDGVKNVNDLANNTTLQAGIIGTGLNKATEGLKTAGVITGKESPTQLSGIVNAAFKTGVGAVTAALGKGASFIKGTAVGAAMSAGTFAGQLADGLKSGLGGLTKSLSGLKDQASGLLSSNPLTALAGAAKNAFSAVEMSFANLKGGQPNVLGGGDVPVAKQASPSDQAVSAYESAQIQIAESEDLMFAAKKAYRDDPSPANLAKLQESEQKLSSARQASAQASKSFLTASTGAIGNAVSSVGKNLFAAVGIPSSAATTLASAQLPPTTLNSGVNALPGGQSALQTVSSNVGAQFKSFATNFGGSATQAAAKALSGALPLSVSAAAGLLTSLKSKVPSLGVDLASASSAISAGAGGVAPATVATDTLNTQQLTAKVGALLGDARVPLPNLKAEPPPKVTTPTQIETNIASKAEALKELNAANAEYRAAAVIFNADNNNKSLEDKFLAAEARVNAAIAAYNALG